MASVVQGHRNPFGKPLADHTVSELDFVLEMASLDEPDRWSFVRGTRSASQTTAMARWSDVLAGGLFSRFIAHTGITKGLAAVTAWRRRQGGGLQPGLTRGGKPIDARDPD